jgi:glycosyltransferase involved in cell wall biosynthesis
MSVKIKLGVDFSPFTGPLTGIGFYTRKMLEALNPEDISITGFSSKLLEMASYATQFKIELPPLFTKNLPSSLWAPLWRQLLLAKQIQQTKMNVFWSPRHVLPWTKIPHIPYLLTINDLVWKVCPQTMDKKNYYHEKLLVPHSVKNAAAIICISETTKQDLMRFLNVSENKIHVSYLAPIHTALIQPFPSTYNALHGNKSFILALGTQEPRKNHRRLIEAYAKLPSTLQQEFKLIIVGKKGWGNTNLTTLVDELNLKSSIFIYDYLSEDIVSYLLQQATCLAFPSLYEGFGLPLVEAMAMGTAVITSNIGAMAEITQDAAILIDPYNVDNIAEGLQTVLQNNSLRKNLKEKGLQRAKSFSWQKTAAQFNAIIHTLV